LSYIGIIITFVFINNFIFTQLLGLCPFLGVSRRSSSAIGMGFALIFIMSLSSLVTWIIYHGILIPFDLDYLQTLTFIVVIAALGEFLEIIIDKISPLLYKTMGIYLPLVISNCAVLGITLIAVKKNYNALESFTAGFAAGLGLLFALFLMSSIREKLDKEWVPKPFRGVPIALITAGLMALAFMAFDMALLKNLIG
jgi:electron transport complex protein RnfA